MNLIDLTVPLNEQTPVYPGDPATRIKPQGTLATDGSNDHYISVGTHVGTHIDAPLHMLADGKNLDAMPVEQFVGKGVYVKVENRQFDLEKLRAADIKQGDIVLFHTGLDEHYHDPAYYSDFPEMPAEVAEYLVTKQIKMVGFDMSGPDHPPFKIHKILLGASILIIENLTNLAELAGKNFTVYALPVKLQLDGAPARVIAQIAG
jgi:kynurenine formamidase